MTVAVIFASTRTGEHSREYLATATRMAELAAQQPGYVDMITVHNPETGEGITVSYFADEESAHAWKQNPEHLEAQRRGIDVFYSQYRIWVADVTRDYAFTRGDSA